MSWEGRKKKSEKLRMEGRKKNARKARQGKYDRKRWKEVRERER